MASGAHESRVGHSRPPMNGRVYTSVSAAKNRCMVNQRTDRSPLIAHANVAADCQREERNGQNIKVYAKDYSKKYHQSLNNQIERQMKRAIKMIGDLWFTSWIDAGQPDLTILLNFKLSEKQRKEDENEEKYWLQKLFKARDEN